MTEFDTEWTEFPKCPHCGEDDQEWWDGLSITDHGDGSEWDAQCGFCDKDYHVSMSTSVNFSTKKGG
jgi:hypothetical protein